MNNLDKLLTKLSKKDSGVLVLLMRQVRAQDDSLKHKISKLANTGLYKIRKGKFRIVFHKEPDRIVIDFVRYRNEKTYKNLPK